MRRSGLQTIAVEPGNRLFGVSGDFLVDSGRPCLVRYLAAEAETKISRDIVIARLGEAAFEFT
jgi:hypothetical protein